MWGMDGWGTISDPHLCCHLGRRPHFVGHLTYSRPGASSPVWVSSHFGSPHRDQPEGHTASLPQEWAPW